MNTKTDISAAYVGSTGVDKLYLGNEVVWQNTPPGPVPYDEQYLTFKITSPGTISFKKNYNDAPTVTIYYKVNSGNWTAITTTTSGTSFNVVSGDTVQFKGDNDFYGYASGTAGRRASANSFSGSTASFNIEGNIMSLIDSQNFATIDQTWVAADHNSAFYKLFQDTHVVDASNLILQPSGATQDLQAEMIYYEFFKNCYDLVAVPELPAMSLVFESYGYMFSDCRSLVQAPVLPATNLGVYCYYGMFSNCTSLTTAPVLPATTLISSCYVNMFRGCTSLNTITCLATNPSTVYMSNWTANVASTGTFYKSPSATGWTTGANGIPVGWTVQDYVDPATIPVLKIAGQSITGTSAGGGNYEWGGLTQYSGLSFTIEVGGIPITADTWDYSENYTDECGTGSEITLETGTTRSTFEVYSGYIDYIAYDPNNNSVYYSSNDDNTSDDPEVICTCQGGCWDGETCQECDPCYDWEGNGYSSWEECTCQNYGENCPEEDPCDDWEGNGYASYEDCTCQERGEGCESEDICENFAIAGYETWDECMCAEHGEYCPEEESGEPEESGE